MFGDLARIKRRADSLYNNLKIYILEGGNYVLPPSTFDKLTISAARILHCRTEILRQSVSYLRDTEINTNILNDMCWRLCANTPKLRQEEVVGNFFTVMYEEDAYIRFCTNKKLEQTNQWMLTFQICTGHCAANTVSSKYSEFAFYNMVKALGYSGHRGYFSDIPARDILGLYAKVKLRPESDELKEGIQTVIEDAQVAAYNRKAIIRRRLGMDACPIGRLDGSCVSCKKCMDDCPSAFRFEPFRLCTGEDLCLEQ